MTATEWLFRKLWDTPKDKLTWYALLRKAQEIEKEQIIDAYVFDKHPHTRWATDQAEQYYNETYVNERDSTETT